MLDPAVKLSRHRGPPTLRVDARMWRRMSQITGHRDAEHRPQPQRMPGGCRITTRHVPGMPVVRTAISTPSTHTSNAPGVGGATAAATEQSRAMTYTSITPAEFDALDGLDDWRYAMGAIHATFLADSYTAGRRARERHRAGSRAHATPSRHRRPLSRPRRTSRSTTHAAGRFDRRDVELARRCVGARGRGRRTVPSRTPPRSSSSRSTRSTPIASARSGRPCWATTTPAERWSIPGASGPPMWFQQMDEPRTERSRFHVDVTVRPRHRRRARSPPRWLPVARSSAIASPAVWWVLADADGNEACVCTWQDRD